MHEILRIHEQNKYFLGWNIKTDEHTHTGGGRQEMNVCGDTRILCLGLTVLFFNLFNSLLVTIIIQIQIVLFLHPQKTLVLVRLPWPSTGTVDMNRLWRETCVIQVQLACKMLSDQEKSSGQGRKSNGTIWGKTQSIFSKVGIIIQLTLKNQRVICTNKKWKQNYKFGSS